MPKISVIVTTFNREQFLHLTIKSILDQTFSDFELLVVDNYSNYNIEALISSYNDSRITLFKNYNFGVIAENRNFGIDRAVGKYLAFCDDDDIWVNNKLAVQYEMLESTDYDLVYSGMYLFKDHITKQEEVTGRFAKSFDDMLQSNPIVLSSVLVKNNSQVRFPVDNKFVTVEDFFLWLNLYNQGYKFCVCEEAFIYYRISENNYSVRIGASKHLKLFHLYTYVFRNFTVKYSYFRLLSLVIINIVKFLVKFIVFRYGVKK
jgi:teichuronic acid biosynthesis glycosyltransferase TuaG